jgi:hypothetical protein
MKYNFTPLQEAWINALETGRFRQGKNHLATRNIKRKTVSYCCLGVACVVARENGVKVSKKMSVSAALGKPVVSFDGGRSYLPKSVQTALNLVDKRGDDLAVLNDMGESHKCLAAKIRQNPQRYFNNIT